MKKVYRFSLIILLLASLTLFQGCFKADNGGERFVIDPDAPEEYIEGIEVYTLKGDKSDYKLRAVTIKNFYDEKLTIAYEAKLDSYDKNGVHYSYIECDSAYVENNANLIKAYGHVYLETPNGIVKTDYIEWDKITDKVLAPNRVIMIRDDNEVIGYNLITDSAFKVTYMDNVKAKGTVDEENLDF